MGHYGGSGTRAATMVHCVLSIDICVMRDLYVKLKVAKSPFFVAGSMVKSPIKESDNGPRPIDTAISFFGTPPT